MHSLFKRFSTSHGFNPRNKVVLITGGADGIGWETSKQLHQLGAKVAIVDRNPQAIQKVSKALGNSVLVITADVTDRTAMKYAVEQSIQHFGGLDLVIANAGITPPSATLRMSSLEDFDKVMAVNVTGVLNTIHPAIETLIEHQGHIVVVASCAAFCPPVAGSAYMISKAAVEQLARGLKLELAHHGVSVTTAYFGVVNTQLAQTTLDNDPVGKSLNSRLPTFLRSRLTAQQAGQVLVGAIFHRAPITIAPTGWKPYAWLRGIVNPIADQLIIHDKGIKQMLQQLEQHNTPNKHSDQ